MESGKENNPPLDDDDDDVVVFTQAPPKPRPQVRFGAEPVAVKSGSRPLAVSKGRVGRPALGNLSKMLGTCSLLQRTSLSLT